MSRAKLQSLTDDEEITLDVVIDEGPEFNSEVSDHPIEDGASVSDHVSLRPISVPMNGVIAGDEAADKIATLRRWRNERHRLRFVGRNIFRNYVISELQTEHDVSVRDGFRFRLVLQEVKIVKPAVAEIVSVDPVQAEPTAEEPDPSPPPAGRQATSTQAKEQEDKGRDTARDMARELTHTPALDALEKQQEEMVRKTVWSGIPGLLEHAVDDDDDKWAGHPARGQV